MDGCVRQFAFERGRCNLDWPGAAPGSEWPARNRESSKTTTKTSHDLDWLGPARPPGANGQRGNNEKTKNTTKTSHDLDWLGPGRPPRANGQRRDNECVRKTAKFIHELDWQGQRLQELMNVCGLQMDLLLTLFVKPWSILVSRPPGS